MRDSSGAAFEPSGVLAAAITPRQPGSNAIDLSAMLEVVDFLGSSGLSGIVLMGTTGEFVHFDLEARARAASLAVKRSRVPVMVNVSHSTLDGAVWLAREAAEVGAAAVLAMPPYFLPYPQEAIRGYFGSFAEQTADGPPAYLYNIPATTSALDPATAIDLLETGLFAGIKDSSGSEPDFSRLLEASRRLPFRLLSGSERIYARGRQAGAHGIVSGAASAIPELLLALERSLAEGDAARIARLDARLVEFIDRIEELPPTFGIKLAAAARGLKAGPTAIPLSGPMGERVREYREWFPAWWRETVRQMAA